LSVLLSFFTMLVNI